MRANINFLNISTPLERVNQLLKEGKATAEITFWGSRVVKIQGYEGSIYLKDFANKIREYSYYRNIDKLTLSERLAGMDITRKVDQWYRDTDCELKAWNCFTNFLCFMRERSWCGLFPELYGVRWHINERAVSSFSSYTRSAFIKEFELTEQDNIKRHKAFDGKDGTERVFVKETALRKKASKFFRPKPCWGLDPDYLARLRERIDLLHN